MLPDKITICNVPYTLTEVGGLERNDEAYYGIISHTRLVIEVEENLQLITKLQSILHESLHGIFHQTGHYDIEQEERVVQALGCQLFHFIRQNPALIDLIRSVE